MIKVAAKFLDKVPAEDRKWTPVVFVVCLLGALLMIYSAVSVIESMKPFIR